jgi:hypothetical protein
MPWLTERSHVFYPNEPHKAAGAGIVRGRRASRQAPQRWPRLVVGSWGEARRF